MLRRNPGCEVSMQRSGSESFALVRFGDRYLKLRGAFFRLFEALDGTVSVNTAIARVFASNDIPPTETIDEFLVLLFRNRMALPVSAMDTDVLERMSKERSPAKASVGSAIGRRMVRARVAFWPADRFVTFLYGVVGRVLFARPSVAAMSASALAGLWLLGAQLSGADPASMYSAVVHGNVGPAAAAMLLAMGLLSMLTHEMAHALACKHYGRRVSGFGVMFYYGVPACFADTTDAWMLSRGKRAVIDGAGMFANAVMGSAFSIAAFLLRGEPVWQVLVLVAAVNYLSLLGNLWPLLRFDGYYILSDLMDRPKLREEGIRAALSRESWVCAIRRNASRAETGVLLFGVASLAFTAVAVAGLNQYAVTAARRIIPGVYGDLAAAVAVVLILGTLASYWRREVTGARNLRV
ncbi:MAG: hypothetical protein CME07_03265 [Gemmatimonadetes bacterium]|nr:hypothetical protein [Gemmatimonadota bacterium]